MNHLGPAWTRLWSNPILWLAVPLLASFASSVTFGLLAGPMMVGILRAVDREEGGGGPGGVDSLLGGLDAFVPSLIVVLLLAVAASVASALCVLPVLLVLPLQLPALWLVARGETDPLRALTRAWALVQPNLVGQAVSYLVLGLVAAAGSLLCGVGIFITMPWAFVASVLLAREVVGPA